MARSTEAIRVDLHAADVLSSVVDKVVKGEASNFAAAANIVATERPAYAPLLSEYSSSVRAQNGTSSSTKS